MSKHLPGLNGPGFLFVTSAQIKVMLKRLLIVVTLICISNIVLAQSSWLWGRGSSSSGGMNKASSVCADQNGNCYVAGSAYGPDITFGSSTFIDTNANLGEVFVAKYDAAGNFLWAFTSSCDAGAEATDIATDTAGNVIITGSYQGSFLILGGFTLFKFPTMSVSSDMFLAKLDPNGNVLWAISNGIEQSQFGNAVKVDPWNNIYVAGIYESDSMLFGATTIYNTAQAKEIFVAKYDAQGNAMWARSAGGIYEESANDLSIDGLGNVVVVGHTTSPTATFGSLQIATQGFDGYIVKYDSAGVELWVRKITGMYAEWTRGVDVDVQGNLYVTGETISDTAWFGPLFVESNVMGDAYLAKYDSSGTPQWARVIHGQYMDFGYKVAVSTSTEIYICVASESDTVDFGALVTAASPLQEYYLCVAKYDNNGNDLCVGVLESQVSGDNGAMAIASDNNGGIFVGGRFGASMIVGPDTLTTNSSAEMVAARFVCNGVVGVPDQPGNNTSPAIYPNPTTGYLNVNVNYQPQAIVIYNSLGEEVLYTKDCSLQTQINLAGLTTGIYSVTVIGESEIQAARIIIE